MKMMKKTTLSLFVAVLLCVGCGTVPITGRKQVLLVSDQEVLSSSLTQYSNYMSTAPRSTNASRTAMVTRVGKRIAAATDQYLRQNGLESELANFAWEFNLVNDKQVNAFCMPGGKIVVYEGLMNLVESEDELAVVVGHEVAHAVAKHSNERMSQQMLAEYGAQILGAAVSQKSEMVQSMAAQVYGLGAKASFVSSLNITNILYSNAVFGIMAMGMISASSGTSSGEIKSTSPHSRIAPIAISLPI